jgi:hypothetical protein
VQQETKKIKSKKKIVDPTRADQNDAVLMAAKQTKKKHERACVYHDDSAQSPIHTIHQHHRPENREE